MGSRQAPGSGSFTNSFAWAPPRPRFPRQFRDSDFTITGREDMRVIVPISVGGWVRLFTRWDILAVLLILGLLVFLGEASRHLFEPLADLQRTPPSLDPANLPEYAARTTLRMLVAMVLSLL